ncbi:hypothetical protein [Clostridium isatidis]|uniref:hypothetical protein n=1 Tax=Clostridium isatidis TaxID=182773 RepID=UPI003AAFCE22
MKNSFLIMQKEINMISKKELMDEIITYDIITYKDEDGKKVEYVEVTLTDRIIDVYMDTSEVNMGILAKKILEDNLYK